MPRRELREITGSSDDPVLSMVKGETQTARLERDLGFGWTS